MWANKTFGDTRALFSGALFSAALFLGAGAAAADGFDVSDLNVLNDRPQPEVCFTFNIDLPEAGTENLGDYVRVSPATKVAVTPSGERLCVAGFAFGQRYDVTLRKGLPSAETETLEDDRDYNIYIPDRPASLAFLGGDRFIVAKSLVDGLPLRAVNVERAKVDIVQINDRNLVPLLAQDQLTGATSIYGSDLRGYRDTSGTPVWEGELQLPNVKENESQDFTVPVGDVLKDLQPGVYLATASLKDQESWDPLASQWFLISDIGLTTFQAENGLSVYARSFADAAPIANVELALLARDNRELGRVTTNAEGFAQFSGALLRGGGGDRPRAVLAYGKGGDFALLDLAAPSLDLADRGIKGRTPPGKMDAFLYTERGIYRPGETVYLTALLRQRDMSAAGDMPVTLKFIRPDGKEFMRRTLNGAKAGGYETAFALSGSARTGQWQATLHLDPKAPPLGRVSFEVEDFVPPQIEFDLTSDATAAAIDKPIPVTVQADYLYGAPAANLRGEYRMIVQAASDPFPDHPGYRFGLVQETVKPVSGEAAAFTTDASGRAQLAAKVEEKPDSSYPLEASIRVAVFDISGRPVYRRKTVPLEDKSFYIGIKAGFEGGSAAENQPASFDVIAVDRDGQTLTNRALTYRFFEEDYSYVWYRDGGQWKSRWVVNDRLIDQGSLQLTGGAPAKVSVTPKWGPYRLEIADADGGIASSYRFYGGWWSDPTADSPDEVEVSLDKKDGYLPGETAKVFVKPPYDATVLITVADSDLRWTTTAEVPRDGSVVDVPVPQGLTAGAYVMANAWPKAKATSKLMPRRAVGLSWLGIKQEPWTLDVTMTLPELIRPERKIEVPVKVSGAAAGSEIYVTLAAVDDAVLQLTGYQAPAPLDHFLAKQALAVQIHDLYGMLIQPAGEVLARLRSGGDQEGRNIASLPKRSSKVVSLYSGIVTLDRSGAGSIALDIPDFNGRLRLMAVAWTPKKLGHAQQTMIVRAPVIAEATLPRFLAPGDEAESLLVLRNLDGPVGRYELSLVGDKVVSVGGAALTVDSLARNAEQRAKVTLTGESIGVAALTLKVTGPEGYEQTRDLAISVRPASPVVSQRQVALLEPGDSIKVDGAAATGFLPETTQLALSVSPTPDFDVPSLLTALDRYPYGCAEQTTSRALPLIYANQVAEALGIADDQGLSLTVQQSIYRLMNMQAPSGAFGLWGPFDSAEVWLTAYVTDFLNRAKENGFHVPSSGHEAALDWLQTKARGYLDSPNDFAGYAYSQFVLANAGRGELSELRYFYETRWEKLPTPFARAQFAAALAYLGDRQRAADAFNRLQLGEANETVRVNDYGTSLRDDAAAVALMAESGAAPARLLASTSNRLSNDFADKQYLSTQEMAWLVLASQGLVKDAGPMQISVDGAPGGPDSKPFYRKLSLDQAEGAPLSVKNEGAGPLYQVLTVMGVPDRPLPANQNGFTLRRRIFDLDGIPVALSDMQQGKSYVVLIEGRSRDGRHHDALVVDLLPAGWEIENAALGEGLPIESLKWLGDLTNPTHSEARDDRYAAGISMTPRNAGFRLAYLVRAVTPGRFVLPGSYVEDMYRPELSAREGARTITITAAN